MSAYHFKYFQNIQFKNHGIAPTPPDLPTLKAYPTPGVSGRFEIFSLKWRERMNLKVPGAILPLGFAILSTRAITARGGWYNPPLRRTRVKVWHTCYSLVEQVGFGKVHFILRSENKSLTGSYQGLPTFFFLVYLKPAASHTLKIASLCRKKRHNIKDKSTCQCSNTSTKHLNEKVCQGVGFLRIKKKKKKMYGNWYCFLGALPDVSTLGIPFHNYEAQQHLSPETS